MQYVIAAEDVVELVTRLDDHGVDVCLSGGWAVDALLGEQTRPHSDLDLWVPAGQLEGLLVALAGMGVDRILPRPGDRPWNFVLHDGDRRSVDLHLYEALPDATVHFGSAVDGITFPADALAGRGTVGDLVVRCEAPQWAVRWHTGYPPRPTDLHDVRLLCARFHLDVPDGFREG